MKGPSALASKGVTSTTGAGDGASEHTGECSTADFVRRCHEMSRGKSDVLNTGGFRSVTAGAVVASIVQQVMPSKEDLLPRSWLRR